MKYIEIQKYLESLKVFWIEDLKILDDKFNKSKLSNWIKSWYITPIIRGFYLYSNIKINQSLLYFISNKIYSPSYISLESALNYYAIIPEQTFSIISVWTNKTINFDRKIWYFNYKKIKNTLFWWYKIIKVWENKFLIADLEKAILDYLYLNKNIKDENDFDWLRWNKEILNEKLNIERIKKYTNMFQSKVIEKKVNLLLNYIKNDQSWIY